MSSKWNSVSDTEVPVVQLCCLPLLSLYTLDLDTTYDFSALLTVLTYGDEEKAYEAARRIRVLLEEETNPSIQSVIEAGGVDVLHTAMKHQEEKVRFEAALAFTNLLSGTLQQTNKVLKLDCIPTLLHLLSSDKSWNIKQQVVWIIGAMASSSTQWRDKVLEAGGLAFILSHLQENTRRYMMSAYWVISNLVAGSPPPASRYRIQAGPFVLARLSLENDSEVNSDLLCALRYITEENVGNIGLSPAHCEMLIRLLDPLILEICLPAIRVIGNILSLSEAYAEVVIEAGILDCMDPLLRHSLTNIRREACWVLRLCSKGSPTIEKVVFSGVLPQVIVLTADTDLAIRKEAIGALVNVCNFASINLKLQLLTIGISNPLIEALSSGGNMAIPMLIEALVNLLANVEEIISPEVLLSYIDIGKLVRKCKELRSQEVAAAESLLQGIAWLVPDDNELFQ